MKRFGIILYIVTLLLASTAVLSCSKGDLMNKGNIESSKGRTIIIMGGVSDKVTGEALEDITIRFMSYLKKDDEKTPVYEETFHSDSKGMFTINSDGADEPMVCIITAEDKNGEYQSQVQEIIITWKGTSYDRKNRTFIVNSCNFQL